MAATFWMNSMLPSPMDGRPAPKRSLKPSLASSYMASFSTFHSLPYGGLVGW